MCPGPMLDKARESEEGNLRLLNELRAKHHNQTATMSATPSILIEQVKLLVSANSANSSAINHA
uniref:Uncharacterized protein n=1 Tax=Romanomermis culicivorax TaxID=13658 RepID=A0A915KFR6_ROMCU